MTFLQGFILFIAAILGGALNSVAGGGSFITFPSLILTGVLPIHANATSTVALCPGSVAGTCWHQADRWCARRHLIVAHLAIDLCKAYTLSLISGNTAVRFQWPNHLSLAQASRQRCKYARYG